MVDCKECVSVEGADPCVKDPASDPKTFSPSWVSSNHLNVDVLGRYVLVCVTTPHFVFLRPANEPEFRGFVDALEKFPW